MSGKQNTPSARPPWPQPLLTRMARLPGLDGSKKMSKSLGNTILLSEDPESVKKKVRSMYTDPKRVRPDVPGTVEGNPVFLYHDVFNANTELVRNNNVLSPTFNTIAQNLSPRIFRVGLVVGF